MDMLLYTFDMVSLRREGRSCDAWNRYLLPFGVERLLAVKTVMRDWMSLVMGCTRDTRAKMDEANIYCFDTILS